MSQRSGDAEYERIPDVLIYLQSGCDLVILIIATGFLQAKILLHFRFL